MTARESWDDANHNLFSILYFTTSGPAFSVVRRFEKKTREDGVGHRQDAWAALREKFDGCSREALRAVHRELETVKIRSDEDPYGFLYKKDRCRDRLNSVTPKEGPSDRRYEDTILQCLPPEYDRIRQTHFNREDCNLADIRRVMSKIYTDNLARSHSDSSRGITGRGVAMQATGRGLSKINSHYCNKFGHYNTTAPTSGSPSPEWATQAAAAQAARRISAGSAEAGRAASAEGRGANVVFILYDHHPQRCRLPHQAGKQAQRPRPLCPSPPPECLWGLQLVGSLCAR